MANILKERFPGLNIYDLYEDIRTYGRGHEQYYMDTLEQMVRFLRFHGDERPTVKKAEAGDTHPVLVEIRDHLTKGEELEIAVDLVVLAVGDVRGIRDQVIDRDRLQQLAAEGLDRGRPRLIRALPGRHPVIAEIGEIRLGVIGIRNLDPGSSGIDGVDSVSDQLSVNLRARRNDGRVVNVAGHQVAVGPIVVHREFGPARPVARIRQADVAPGGNDLIAQRHRGDRFGVGDLRGHAHGLARQRSDRGVVDLADLGRGHRREDRILSARRGSCSAGRRGL